VQLALHVEGVFFHEGALVRWSLDRVPSAKPCRNGGFGNQRLQRPIVAYRGIKTGTRLVVLAQSTTSKYWRANTCN
jgi:hypothetical protein